MTNLEIALSAIVFALVAAHIFLMQSNKSTGKTYTEIQPSHPLPVETQRQVAELDPNEVSIEILPSIQNIDYESISDDELAMQYASTALGSVIRVLPTIGEASNQFVKISFSEHVMNGLANGRFEMMVAKGGGIRNIAVDSASGKIVEHGRLLIHHGPTATQVLTFAFQFVTVAVGLEHMRQINKKLDDLRNQISDVSFFQKEERQARIVAATRQLEYIATVLTNTNATYAHRELFLSELLQTERDLMDIYEHFALEIDRKCKDLLNLENRDTFGSGNTYAALSACFADVENACIGLTATHFLLLHCRSILLKVSDSVTVHATFKKLEDLFASTTRLTELKEQSTLFERHAKKLLKKSRFNRKKTLENRRSQINERIRSLNYRLESYVKELQELEPQTRSHMKVVRSALTQGLELVFEIGTSGQVLRALAPTAVKKKVA